MMSNIISNYQREELLKQYDKAELTYHETWEKVKDNKNPCEKLRYCYWDGKRNGLKLALQILGIENIKEG